MMQEIYKVGERVRLFPVLLTERIDPNIDKDFETVTGRVLRIKGIEFVRGTKIKIYEFHIGHLSALGNYKNNQSFYVAIYLTADEIRPLRKRKTNMEAASV